MTATTDAERRAKKTKEKTNAKHQKEIEALRKKVDEIVSHFKEHQNNDEISISLFTLAIAIANADNNIVCEEIETFTAILKGNDNIHTKVKAKIESLIKNPPSIDDAIDISEKLLKKDIAYMELIQLLISEVVKADGKIKDGEIQFIEYFEKRYQIKIDTSLHNKEICYE
jgi:uncharacterized tellurite resistance protein B-like protein